MTTFVVYYYSRTLKRTPERNGTNTGTERNGKTSYIRKASKKKYGNICVLHLYFVPLQCINQMFHLNPYKMKLTTKQKIEWIQHRDFTGILQYCTQAEQLACYPALLKSYRAELKEGMQDDICTTLTLHFVTMCARLVKQYGRKGATAKRQRLQKYVDRKFLALQTYSEF